MVPPSEGDRSAASSRKHAARTSSTGALAPTVSDTASSRPVLRRTTASPGEPPEAEDDSSSSLASSTASSDTGEESSVDDGDDITPLAQLTPRAGAVSPSTRGIGTRSLSSDSSDKNPLRASLGKRMMSEQQRAALSGKGSVPEASGTPQTTVPIRDTQDTERSPLTATSTPSTDTLPSSGSGRTVKGPLPTPGASQPLRTPSYPFPYVPGTPRGWSPAFHQPFTILSPTTPRGADAFSAGSTPVADPAGFAPPGAAHVSYSDPRYPSPNLYETVLQLNTEPGLDAWWSTVTKIFHDFYLADRISLALPADSNDIENVPWGQKATFNVLGHNDDTSETRSSNKDASSDESQSQTQDYPRSIKPQFLRARPGLESRHSYSGVGMTKESPPKKQASAEQVTPMRPVMPMRAATHMPSMLRHESQQSMGFTPVLQQDRQPSLSDPAFSNFGDERNFVPHRSVYPVLKSLEHEVDGLIDAGGINKVLERGSYVTLTRDYSLDQDSATPAATTRHATKPGAATESQTFKSIFSQSNARTQRKGSLYEEYEQQPVSTWSQSPAPSPAIQADPDENPFFAETDSVEDTFNPAAPSPDYANLQAIEAIGVDKATTVIHLPLIHPTLSGTLPPLGEPTPATSSSDSAPGFDTVDVRQRRAPVAIISLLSPAVPFPSNLTHSLKLLGPHLASSFSLALQWSVMQDQMASVGYGRGLIGRNLGTSTGPLSLSQLDELSRDGHDDAMRSLSGSIASPSDYSGRSRHSPGSSLAGTPGWDMSTSRSVSGTPAGHGHGEANEGYFERKRGHMSRAESVSSDTPPQMVALVVGAESKSSSKRFGKDHQRRLKIPLPQSSSEKSPLRSSFNRSQSPPRSADAASPRRLHFPSMTKSDVDENADRLHSVLHSYGADFASTFQTLPATTARGSASSHSRSTPDGYMPSPSERLLRTIIDSLPVQIFTAAPGTGDLTWVNSKFLVYRGQESRDVLKDPWEAVHPEDRSAYVEQWNKCLKTGQQLQQKVRIQRFDGNYRWFFVKVAPLKDKRQTIVHWIGTNMDFHEQHIAELNAARQQETATSEAKYRALANSSPQVVFTVNRVHGITFCNSQWTSYSGQTRQQGLGLGFMEHVHPDDIIKCRLPIFDDGKETPVNVPTTVPGAQRRATSGSHQSSSGSSDTEKAATSPVQSPPSSGLPQRKLSELASTGILKVTRDADGRQSYSTEVRLRTKDGEYRWHLVRAVRADPEILNEGDEETWYGTCTDINDHKALERDLKETMDEKSRFLSNMSHEIRTPLNGITGMVNFLIDSNLSEEQMEHINIIRTSTEGLRGLINDILDLSKAEAGMIQLSMDWVHIRSLIEEVNDLTSAMAVDKGLELNYVVEPDVPAQIKGDRFRIRQILLNVIGNAIKFTAKGEVFVRCSIVDADQAAVDNDKMLIQFEVVDTGQGFTDKEADHLFKRFSQIDGSSTRQHGGTGLGLVISKQLAQLHGGDMSAKGFPGKGATFVFSVMGGLPSLSDHPPRPAMTPGSVVGSIAGSIASSLAGSTTSSIAGSRAGSIAESAPSTTSILKTTKSKPRVPGAVGGRHLQGSPLTAEMHRPGLEAARRTSKPSPSISLSSSGSDPSTTASQSTFISQRSSMSSIHPDMIPAREPMELSLPPDGKLSRIDSSKGTDSRFGASSPSSPPPMYSILVVCPLKYSREATVKHVEMTLPAGIPHSITARESLLECQKMIGGEEPIMFSHVVLILQEVQEVLAFMDQLLSSAAQSTAQLIVITDLNQRRAIMEQAPQHDYEALAAERRLQFIFKPLKPSKFAFIFDPQKEREMSTDRNQDSAQQVALTQKQLYDNMTKRLGNKGKRVLLVEDNRVNQMVMLKFLSKVSVQVETVADGVLCTEKVFAHPHGHYSIILCDLHMPNKDGYQTCKEIRRWEKQEGHPYLPIIALSANVLGDVYAKCVEAGFNSYVTKPVDFKELAAAMLTFMDPSEPGKPIEFMKMKRK